MPPSALRIGLIGAGRMGTAHAGFIAREEETVLVGVAGSLQFGARGGRGRAALRRPPRPCWIPTAAPVSTR